MTKSALSAEIFFLFFCPPLLVVSGLLPKEAMMLILWAVSLYAYLLLRRTDIKLFAIDFERQAFYAVLKRFLLITLAITVFILLYEPETFFNMVRSRPLLWLQVMLLYPFISAYVQEILFRSFFFYRYRKLFGKSLVFVLVNALLFSYVHIIFENWIAVVFTFFGGLLFAHTYLKTRSTMLTAIEHSLYGNLLYTLGLGHYFYNGTSF